MRFAKLFSITALLGSAAFGQTDYMLKGTDPVFTADTLYLGGEITRWDLVNPVRIQLSGNSAMWTGNLYFVDPVTGVETYLMNNKDAIGTTADLGALGLLGSVGLNTPITFMYKVVSGGGTIPAVMDKKYSGSNLTGISKYVSAMGSDANTNTNKRYGSRWCVVGKRATDATWPLEFGFEDNSCINGTCGTFTSDMDFNDIVFKTQGLVRAVTSRSLASKGFVW